MMYIGLDGKAQDSMELENWEFLYSNGEKLRCKAPCSMYSVLLDYNRIPDPFVGTNDQIMEELADQDCTFTAKFQVDPNILHREFVELTFEGLDTICSIILNGTTLGQTKNMHRSYTFDVKALLKADFNELRLEFQSPTRYFAERDRRHYLYSNDGCTIPGAAHLRKALYMSGWDWAPKLPDMGIWRPVRLRGYDLDRIRDVQIRQRHHDGIVDVEVSVETEKHSNGQLKIWMEDPTLHKIDSIPALDGSASIRIDDPELWWVRGYGKQPLYTVHVELIDQNEERLDSWTKRIGLRTLTVSTQEDADRKGSEFCFVNNGVRIFSMGANYVPQDSLLTRVTREKLDEMMQQCLDANFNSLRVWGGGVYPDEHFYDLCDENGILVWQDFMIACANVWLTPQFEVEVRAEAEENLKRIRHHACVGLICGNNEMESAVLNWGIGNSQLVREDYIELYERILPQIADTLAPDIFYWPSSPCSGGGLDDPDNCARGDVHYWEVWHGGVPFTTYRQKHFRFCSEYGFESFPSMKTIRSFCEEQDMNCFSRVMEDHQKCIGGNGKILRYLADNYLYPTSFEALVYASQLLQADAIKYGVQHFRRERGYCMGSLYWQFNDCWPVASWSSVDYFGRYKALHYAARRFYAPVAIGLFLENHTLKVNLSNETMEDFHGEVRLYLRKNDFMSLDEIRQQVSVKKLTSWDVCTYEIPNVDPYESFLAVELLDQNGQLLAQETQLMVPCKHFRWLGPKFSIRCSDMQTDGEVLIEIASNVYAQGVFLDFDQFDCVLSDNFFPVIGRSPYRVIARTKRKAMELEENLRILSVFDIR